MCCANRMKREKVCTCEGIVLPDAQTIKGLGKVMLYRSPCTDPLRDNEPSTSELLNFGTH